MDAHLRAGIAIFNAGGYHAAHDAWEDRWLELTTDTDDERFLHGLIQFTAAIHHGYNANWEGLRGLAESAGEYLDGLPAEYRGVCLDPVRTYLAALCIDPEHIERTRHPSLTYEGEPLHPADLDFEAATVAAAVLAEEFDTYDEDVIEDAVGYAREAFEVGEHDAFISLVVDFATDAERRSLVYRRLADRVSRRRSRERDVDGVFDP